MSAPLIISILAIAISLATLGFTWSRDKFTRRVILLEHKTKLLALLVTFKQQVEIAEYRASVVRMDELRGTGQNSLGHALDSPIEKMRNLLQQLKSFRREIEKLNPADALERHETLYASFVEWGADIEFINKMLDDRSAMGLREDNRETPNNDADERGS